MVGVTHVSRAPLQKIRNWACVDFWGPLGIKEVYAVRRCVFPQLCPDPCA